jgi:hypothetical protein
MWTKLDKTYTLEVNGEPAVVFRSPDITEAERFAADWPRAIEQRAGAGFFYDKQLRVRPATHTERARWWKESCAAAEAPDEIRAWAELTDDPEERADLLEEAERYEQLSPDGLVVSLGEEDGEHDGG